MTSVTTSSAITNDSVAHATVPEVGTSQHDTTSATSPRGDRSDAQIRERERRSHVEAELHDVPVGHDVFLALHADPSGGTGGLHAPGLHEVVEGDDLGLDEAALEVRVDLSGRFGGRGSLRDRPGPA